tara:strand:- start:6801 stop:7049 length:249 start_codon:yes stop_codon:yes gene_type:complete
MAIQKLSDFRKRVSDLATSVGQNYSSVTVTDTTSTLRGTTEREYLCYINDYNWVTGKTPAESVKNMRKLTHPKKQVITEISI